MREIRCDACGRDLTKTSGTNRQYRLRSVEEEGSGAFFSSLINKHYCTEHVFAVRAALDALEAEVRGDPGGAAPSPWPSRTAKAEPSPIGTATGTETATATETAAAPASGEPARCPRQAVADRSPAPADRRPAIDRGALEQTMREAAVLAIGARRRVRAGDLSSVETLTTSWARWGWAAGALSILDALAAADSVGEGEIVVEVVAADAAEEVSR